MPTQTSTESLGSLRRPKIDRSKETDIGGIWARTGRETERTLNGKIGTQHHNQNITFNIGISDMTTILPYLT
jgi:hypothetical protein